MFGEADTYLRWRVAGYKFLMNLAVWFCYLQVGNGIEVHESCCSDVLVAMATTLPTKEPVFSNSRLGQYLKVETAEAAVASAKAAKELAGSEAALRAAKGTAVVRATGPMLDVMIAALNPDVLSTAAILVLRKRMDTMYNEGVLSLEDYTEARNLLSQNKYGELKTSLDRAQSAYVKGGGR